jgi:hypothetical protein
MMKKLLISSLLTLGILFLASAQTAPPLTFEGTVVSVVLDHVQIKTAGGDTRVVVLPPGVTVIRRVLVPWTDIHSGEWVGVDSKPGTDGSQESVSINIFSPGIMAIARKGQFTMDSGDLMTNAPVDKITTGTDGQGLTLKNEGAMVDLKIGSGTVVHRLIDTDAAEVKAQVKVQVRGSGNSDGSVQAAVVTILAP